MYPGRMIGARTLRELNVSARLLAAIRNEKQRSESRTDSLARNASVVCYDANKMKNARMNVVAAVVFVLAIFANSHLRINAFNIQNSEHNARWILFKIQQQQ